jgi:hypothetical protein
LKHETKEIENQIKAISGNAPVLEKLYELLDGEDAIASWAPALQPDSGRCGMNFSRLRRPQSEAG